MDYPQDLINHTHQSAQDHLLRKAQINENLSVQSLVNILQREGVPEPLARTVAENLITQDDVKDPTKARRYIIMGLWLLLVGIAAVLLSYWYTDGNYIVLVGLAFVPALGYLGAGIWEYLDQ